MQDALRGRPERCKHDTLLMLKARPLDADLVVDAPCRSSSHRDVQASASLSPPGLLQRTSSSTYVYPGGGLTVKQGVYELTSDIPIYRVQPYIYESDVRPVRETCKP